MSSTDTNIESEDKAFHPNSPIAGMIKDNIIKTLRVLINENLDGASFTALTMNGVFKVTIERDKS